MTTIGEAIIQVRGDTSGLSGDIQRGTSPGKMSKLGSMAGKGLALGFTAAAGAVLAGGAFLKGAFDEAEDAAKVGKLTVNAIKATGGAANISAEQVGNLSGAISSLVGIDDEAIQTGANLLLTFKNIRNEAGKGNKVFNQATKAAVDLSAAGFGSIESASVLMGKALNDPIKGVSALGKSGVTFSEDQKAMIASLVESGDLLGAQKIILKEVNGQVGGAAAAQASAADKMGVAWGNFKEDIGTALMPVFTRLMDFITVKVIPGMSKFGPVLTDIAAKVGPFVAGIKGFFSSFGGGGDEASSKMNELRSTVAVVFESIKSIISSVTTIISVIWKAHGDTLVAYAKAGLTNILQIVRGAFNVLAGIFKVIGAVLKGDWKGVWEGIKQIVRGAMQVQVAIVRQIGNILRTLFTVIGTSILGVWRRVWSAVTSLVRAGLQAAANATRAGIDNVMGFIRNIPDKVRNVAGAFLTAGKKLGSSVIDGIKSGISATGGLLSDIGSQIKSAINGALNLPITLGKGPLKFTIPAFARGTNFAPGGLSLVGEKGPELVDLPRGSKVITAARTRAMAGSLGGGSTARTALRVVSGTLAADPSVGIYLRDIVVEEIDDHDDFAGTMGRMA